VEQGEAADLAVPEGTETATEPEKSLDSERDSRGPEVIDSVEDESLTTTTMTTTMTMTSAAQGRDSDASMWQDTLILQDAPGSQVPEEKTSQDVPRSQAGHEMHEDGVWHSLAMAGVWHSPHLS
jgi:hypothetical protein